MNYKIAREKHILVMLPALVLRIQPSKITPVSITGFTQKTNEIVAKIRTQVISLGK